MLKLVVGLGNPGERFARTRHNVGFRLLDRLGRGGEGGWKGFRGLGETRRLGPLILGKPSTFMNESGRFVREAARFHRVEPAAILVCFDDVSLPLGRLRIRKEGSAGGQKGMESVIRELGTSAVPRLRIGIGPQPPFMDSADFVLSRFSSDEEAALDEALEKAYNAIEAAAADGLDAAMNRYNPA